MTLTGSGFGAGEQVLLVVRVQTRRLERVVRADPGGRFRATIPALELTGKLRCAAGVTIVARSPRRGLVLWHPGRLPDCATPPLQPA